VIAVTALMLATGAAVAPGQIVDPDFVGNFGVWNVRCPPAPRDTFDRLQCEARAVVDDVAIVARRENEEVQFELSSPKCPGVVAEASAPRNSLNPRNRNLGLSVSQMIQGVLSGTLSLSIPRCEAFETRLVFNRTETDRAFEIVTSSRRPKK